MIRVDSHFYLSFASRSLDFGKAIIPQTAKDEPCGDQGRFLIPMSISRWDTHAHLLAMAAYSSEGDSVVTYQTAEKDKTDIMTATFSVDDTTVQVARISGLMALVKSIPQVKALQKMKPSKEDHESAELKNIFSSWVADDVRGCLVEAAINYTAPWMHITNGPQKKPDPHKLLATKEHEEKEMARLIAEGLPIPEKPGSEDAAQHESDDNHVSDADRQESDESLLPGFINSNDGSAGESAGDKRTSVSDADLVRLLNAKTRL